MAEFVVIDKVVGVFDCLSLLLGAPSIGIPLRISARCFFWRVLYSRKTFIPIDYITLMATFTKTSIGDVLHGPDYGEGAASYR